MKQHGADSSTLRLLAGLVELLKSSVWLWQQPDDKGRKNIIAMHYFAAKLKLDGREGFALLRVREQDDFHLYFDGDFTDAGIIEKGDPAQTAPSKTEGNPKRLSQNKLLQWWMKVKPDDEPCRVVFKIALLCVSKTALISWEDL